MSTYLLELLQDAANVAAMKMAAAAFKIFMNVNVFVPDRDMWPISAKYLYKCMGFSGESYEIITGNNDICILRKYFWIKMKFSKVIMPCIAVAALFASVSCKKDKDDSVTQGTLTGTLDFDSPAYVRKGEVVKAVPKGLSKNTVDIGYYWTASPLYTKRDTTRRLGDPASVDGTYTFTVKDTTLMTFTISCVAFADGYYTKSASYYCTMVDPEIGGTMSGDDIDAETPTFLDERTGYYLYYKTIGDLDWLVRNLYTDDGHSYLDSPAVDPVFGQFYTWTEAQDACPDGWRLPTDADWLALAKVGGYKGEDAATDFLGVGGALMANASFNGTRMWTYWPAVKITNSTGFAAIPTGYGEMLSTGASFKNDLDYAVYWSAESHDEEQGVYRMINMNRPDVMRGTAHKDSFLASVRCVRDVE